MQRITKQTEPSFLADYRRSSEADWDRDVRKEDRDEARTQLCREQGSLCCFCEGRIRATPREMKIAHFVPQTNPEGAELMFAWTNLLGACLGGQTTPGEERRAPKQQHCDTRQGDAVLDPRLHPVRLAPGTISFRSNGTIVASDGVLQADIDEKLNLNMPQLVQNRRAAADEMIRRIGTGKPWTRGEIRRKYEELRDDSTVERVEYQSYLLWWLEKSLRAHG